MIFVVADHGGFARKQQLVEWLRRLGHTVQDLGPRHRVANDDYPIRAAALAKAVQGRPGSFGIAVCRSGVGMALAANKHRGIRATQAFNATMAAKSRHDEDTNILSLAADYQSFRLMTAIITRWLATPFSHQPRHRRRLRQLARMDHGR